MAEISQIDVTYDAQAERFEARLPGIEDVAFLEVDQRDDLWNLTHTEVPASFRGRGVGSALVQGALQYVRDRGAMVRPLCPFVVDYLKQTPGELDVVHPRFRSSFE